jgi:hypothetical protein
MKSTQKIRMPKKPLRVFAFQKKKKRKQEQKQKYFYATEKVSQEEQNSRSYLSFLTKLSEPYKIRSLILNFTFFGEKCIKRAISKSF